MKIVILSNRKREEFRKYPKKPRSYWVSDLGRVYSVKNNKFLDGENHNGYRRISVFDKIGNKFYRKRPFVHRMVADAFLPKPTKEQTDVNHIDGNGHNNALYNLELCTRSQNVKHAFDNGLKRAKIGMSNHNAKLSAKQVFDIRKMFDSGNFTNAEIARCFSVTARTIYKIGHRISYKDVI